MLDQVKGRIDYWTRPGLRQGKALFDPSWRGLGPMNGQPSRREAVTKILIRTRASMIVETGTYRGITTNWLSRFAVPVHTIEVNPRLYAYSSQRLRKRENVTCHLGRSLDVIESLQPEPNAFFYLDAHWDADVPALDELREIASRWPDAVILIDDFQVPGDSYGWLDRGPGRELTAEMLDRFQMWNRWYPATPAYLEPGQNTGWVVLGQGPRDRFDSILELRRLGS